uniref:DUF7344 domain-containing protein n=1 Tax=Haloarcula amylovorans TaxID=2562280 RepID=UPI0010765805|nr:hypothetical protein [Halomicroarcula amylolytica]
MVKLRELVDWVAGQEEAHNSDQYESIAIALHHTHLPKLAEHEVLDYDVRSRTVRYHGHSALEQLVTLYTEISGDGL